MALSSASWRVSLHISSCSTGILICARFIACADLAELVKMIRNPMALKSHSMTSLAKHLDAVVEDQKSAVGVDFQHRFCSSITCATMAQHRSRARERPVPESSATVAVRSALRDTTAPCRTPLTVHPEAIRQERIQQPDGYRCQLRMPESV